MIVADWQARHGLTAAEHQTEFDRLTGRGYRLIKISGYELGAQPRFAPSAMRTADGKLHAVGRVYAGRVSSSGRRGRDDGRLELMVQQWPEGPAADPDAARERYTSGLRAARAGIREVLRADLSDAHLGLGCVVVASVVLGFVVGPVSGTVAAGVFAALYTATLAVMLLRGIKGVEAGRRAYLFTFGWGQWL